MHLMLYFVFYLDERHSGTLVTRMQIPEQMTIYTYKYVFIKTLFYIDCLFKEDWTTIASVNV